MRQKEIFKKIGTIIQELTDQYDYLKLADDNLNDIELELFAANAHFLTDHIEILCKLNLQNKNINPVVENTEPKAGQKYFEPVVQQVKYDAEAKEEKQTEYATSLTPPEKLDVKVYEDRPVVNIDLKPDTTFDAYTDNGQQAENLNHGIFSNSPKISELKYKDTEKEYQRTEEIYVNDVVDVFQTATAQQGKETIKLTEDTPVAAPDIRGGVPMTINQKISSQLAEKLPAETEKVNGPPISDLKQGITLNDKLLYVRDLFNGYNLAYSEAVEILNRFTSFDEAQRFLKTNYVVKNNWENKPGTTEKFYALLKRRYVGR